MIGAILRYSIGSLFYGGLITVVFLALFIFTIKGWYKDAVFRPISFIVLGVLTLIILWNSTIVCGALAMKSDILSIQTMVESTITDLDINDDYIVTASQSNEIFQEVVNQHPILGYYANYCDFSGWSIAELPSTMCNTLRKYLNGIIMKSLLWSAAFVAVASIIVIKTMKRASASYKCKTAESRNYYRSSRRNRTASRNRRSYSR